MSSNIKITCEVKTVFKEKVGLERDTITIHSHPDWGNQIILEVAGKKYDIVAHNLIEALEKATTR